VRLPFQHFLEQRRRRRFMAAFPMTFAQDLELVASALRSGASLLQALQVAAEADESALAHEWERVLKDLRLGATYETVLLELKKRIPHPAVQSFALAVTITQSSGGNLAGVLLTLAQTLRQEWMFQGKLQAMTAQGKMSGYIISAIPFFLLLVLSLLAPELITPLFNSAVGAVLLMVIAVMVALGSLMIRKIVTIEV
jgi:tight adherence protein B